MCHLFPSVDRCARNIIVLAPFQIIPAICQYLFPQTLFLFFILILSDSDYQRAVSPFSKQRRLSSTVFYIVACPTKKLADQIFKYLQSWTLNFEIKFEVSNISFDTRIFPYVASYSKFHTSSCQIVLRVLLKVFKFYSL